MASKPKKAAKSAAPKDPKPAAAKPSSGRAHPPKPKGMSLEERVAALENWALEAGAHLPHVADGSTSGA